MKKGNKMKRGNKTTWAAACLLFCAAAWGGPVPSGAMIAELKVHCAWGSTSSETACTALIERLEAVERPSRAQRLALIWSRNYLRGFDPRPGGEACVATEALAAEHPDYADALYYLSHCTGLDLEESVALLLRAAEIEPDNYRVVEALFTTADTLHPETIDPGTAAMLREALYESAKARVPWRRSVLPEERAADPVVVWSELLGAASKVYVAAMRGGDLNAAEAMQVRVRRDAGLDALDYGGAEGDRRAGLALACHPALYGYLGLEEICLAGIEAVAERVSADGLALPGYVLKAVDYAADTLRSAACAASKGRDPWGGLSLFPGDCLPGETETPAVRRLRAVLEHHGGPRSSEHHRVLAQGFLGGDDRLDALRAALRADAGNEQARCDLATALNARGDSEGAAALGGDPECLDLGDSAWGDRGIHASHLDVP